LQHPDAQRSISVGWSDIYDLADAGQSIDINESPRRDVLVQGHLGSFNYFKEKDESNNITDLKVQIAARP